VLCVCRYYDNVCAQSVHDEEFSAARAQRAVGLRPVELALQAQEKVALLAPKIGDIFLRAHAIASIFF
jgi:hypothetical protein